MNQVINKIKVKFSRGSHIQQKMMAGTFWNGIGNGLEQLTRTARNIILAWIIAPEILSYFYIVLSVSIIIQSLLEVGVKESLVQHPDGNKPEFKNTLFIVSIFRCLIFFVITWFMAPLISLYYDKPDLTDLLRILIISPVIFGTISPRFYEAYKEMDFKKIMIISNLGNFIGLTITILLCLIFKNIYALIIGNILEFTFQTVLSYIILPFKPSFKIDKKYFKDIMSFIRGIFGLPILTAAFMRADIFFIGKMLTDREIGLYGMTVSLAVAPSMLMNKFVGALFTPLFAKLQDDLQYIGRIISKILRILISLGIPLLTFTFLFGKEVITVFFPRDGYAEMTLTFSTLLTSHLIRSFMLPIASIFIGIGKPQLHRFTVFLRVVILCACLYPLISYYGAFGAALSSLIAVIVSLLLQLLQLRSVIKYKIDNILPATAFMAIAILILASIRFLTAYTDLNKYLSLAIASLTLMGIFISAWKRKAILL